MNNNARIYETTPIESIPRLISGQYSNGIRFTNIFRSSVLAILQRGYVDGKEFDEGKQEAVEWAEITTI